MGKRFQRIKQHPQHEYILNQLQETDITQQKEINEGNGVKEEAQHCVPQSEYAG